MPGDHNETFKTLLIQTGDKPIKYGDPIHHCKALRHVLCKGVQATSRTGCEK
jgi:hypothetical protein